MSTLGCMRTHLTRMVFVGALGMVLASAALVMPQVSWADGTKTEANTPENSVPNANYDESQPGADDPSVKEAFAAYKAGDFKKAYDTWLPLAEAGNAEAQFRVGRLYSFGESADKDGDKAVHWYKNAASLGHTIAMHNLAYILKVGEKVGRDVDEAIIYYTLAAESGYVISQFGLGITFATLEDKYRNFSLAYKWLYIAMKNGHIEAMDTIRDLNQFATTEERNEGLERMHEWFENHSR